MSTPCESDPDRWASGDTTVQHLCVQCPVRLACAASALAIIRGGTRIEGIWAGVLLPPVEKNGRARGHAVKHLNHISEVASDYTIAG